MINVLLADDHKLFLDGIRAVLELDDSIHIIGEALNGEEVIQIMEKLHDKIDVVVLDIEMPEVNGIDAAKEIISKYPTIKVLIVSMYNRKNFIMNLMKIGISGYVLKNKSKEELVYAIHNVYKGQPHFGLEIMTTIASRGEDKEPESPLTNREIEVLCKIAEAKPSKQIAKEMNISQATVNTHRRNLLLKLDKPNDKSVFKNLRV